MGGDCSSFSNLTFFTAQLQIEELTRKLRTNDLGIPPNPEDRLESSCIMKKQTVADSDFNLPNLSSILLGLLVVSKLGRNEALIHGGFQQIFYILRKKASVNLQQHFCSVIVVVL